ncbi:beta-lactamase family protein [Altererythrobacter sp. SALINAS58]|uniref:serine hydrolase n=1 Tax=Alteripontixanthobacter muriae TaxID=2705546 RepID=UPI0015759794|nr:serine hydrolase [Alteripontixanthobacter muriae]NTZ43266.1 beta-lactamase family protein [Alteripontixanthobacter muriae]
MPLASQQVAEVAPLVPESTSAIGSEDTGNLYQPGSAQLTEADVEAWLDGYLPASLARTDIPGAVVSVVKDGEILVSKGYGYADVAAEIPMDGDRTLTRIGSTSKPFTWTAVMQLVEQGKLDLDRDINEYLDFEIDHEPYRPITLRDLLNHRAGFEEGLKNLLMVDPENFPTTEAYLKQNRRPVMFPPGEVPAYSNYGTALAGYIVERVSGEPYDEYIERHILEPLDMERSTTRQPLPSRLTDGMARGYMDASSPPRPFEIVTTAPAGSISATATDMARFMIAHLQQGQYEDAQILEPDTARLMHSASAPHREGFSTIAHGFFRGRENGRLVIGHGGDTVAFHTDMNLLLEENVGIFVSFNGRGASDAVYAVREDLFEAFMDRYFPAPAGAGAEPLPVQEHVDEIVGAYESSRRVESGFIGLFYLLQQEEIIGHDDGTISLASGEEGERFHEVEPYVWQEIGGERRLALTEVDGRKAVIDSDNPISVLQAVPFARSSALNMPVLAASLLILLVTLVAWTVKATLNRVYGRAESLSGPSRTAAFLSKLSALAVVLYLVGWFLILQPVLANDLHVYDDSLDSWVRLMQVAAIVPIAGVLICAWNSWLAFKDGRGRLAIAGSLLLLAAMIGVLWIAYMGGLMSWNLNY